MSIPPIIFQTWKSKTDIPEHFAYWSETLRNENPTYMYRLWDDADNRAFVVKNYPWFLERYDSYPAEIYRADAIRYFFLFQFGGIYADMDTEGLRSLDALLNQGGVVLGRMGPNPNHEHSMPNALMMSEPRQEFWLFVMSLLLDPPKEITVERPEYVTGPVILKLAHDTYMRDYREDVVQMRVANIRSRLKPELAASDEKTNIVAMPGNIFFPLDWNDKVHDTFLRKPMLEQQGRLDRDAVRRLFPNSYTVTFWSHSWETQND
jgi:inositol phosphorylceramide mannosyltransferase catalytic subunit